jgi:hypothetical protein
MERGLAGEPDTVFDGAKDFQPNGARYVKWGELRELQPLIPVPSELSPRGALSLERYTGKRRFSLQERVIAALADKSLAARSQSNYEIAATTDPTNPYEATLPENKFVRYLLDENHPEGGSKAKFFRETLGIEHPNWRYLAAHSSRSKV